MQLALFGIENDGLNLAVNLFILMLVVVWLALIVYTFFDARRRISDPVLVACATAASFFPFIGTAVYTILRPPEYLEDARERELETQAAELRVRQLDRAVLPQLRASRSRRRCLRCPDCQRRLKDPARAAASPSTRAGPLCPYCETALRRPATRRQPARAQDRRAAASRAARSDAPPRQRPARRAPAARGRHRGGTRGRGLRGRGIGPALRRVDAPAPRRQREQPARASRSSGAPRRGRVLTRACRRP